VDVAARLGNPEAVHFPRAKVAGSAYDFSFSGLKSAVLNHLNSARMKGEAPHVSDIAASFQKAVVDVLVEHSLQAVRDYGCDTIAIAGGVAANTALRAAFFQRCAEAQLRFLCPSPSYCTDNAVMIAQAAYYEYQQGNFAGYDLNAVPGLELGVRT
jgi:N6-L-threonylcarbamoyladenine synthase